MDNLSDQYSHNYGYLPNTVRLEYLTANNHTGMVYVKMASGKVT